MTRPEAARQFAVDVVQRLQQAGFQALFAGGCVRDYLLGRTPKDYDVATNARPDEIRELFGRGRTLAIGESFGVISVRGPRAAGQIDVATFREDGVYSDGRHPDAVRFSTPEMDARRRDFTINGLFYDPIARQVLDYVGGQSDLDAKVIRAIGDPEARFAEDRLRMLRAIRFAAHFEFVIDEQTLSAIRRAAAHIGQVSGERIGNELRWMLGHRNRHLAFSGLWQSGLLAELVPPQVRDLIAEPEQRSQVLTSLEKLNSTRFESAVALIVCELPDREQVIDELSRRVKFSKDEATSIRWISAQIANILDADQSSWPKLQRILIHPLAREALACAAAFAQPRRLSTAGIEFCRRRLDWPAEQLNPPPLVDGNDLQRLSIAPGPLIGELLHEIRNRQLLGEICDRESALAYAQRFVR